MNRIQLLLFLIFLSFSSALIAQNVKPAFKSFTLVYYRPSGTGDQKFIRIEYCDEINREGIINKVDNDFKDHYGDLSYEGSMRDTTYRVPDSLIAIMNKVFADGKELNHQTDWKPLANGTHFAGPLTFISYVDALDRTHNFIMAVDSDVDKNVHCVLNKLLRLKFARIYHEGQVYRNSNLEAIILKCHNNCKSLWEIEGPPSVKMLLSPKKQ